MFGSQAGAHPGDSRGWRQPGLAGEWNRIEADLQLFVIVPSTSPFGYPGFPPRGTINCERVPQETARWHSQLGPHLIR